MRDPCPAQASGPLSGRNPRLLVETTAVRRPQALIGERDLRLPRPQAPCGHKWVPASSCFAPPPTLSRLHPASPAAMGGGGEGWAQVQVQTCWEPALASRQRATSTWGRGLAPDGGGVHPGTWWQVSDLHSGRSDLRLGPRPPCGKGAVPTPAGPTMPPRLPCSAGSYADLLMPVRTEMRKIFQFGPLVTVTDCPCLITEHRCPVI